MQKESEEKTAPKTGELLKRVLLHCKSKYDKIIIATAMDIIERNLGCNSPIEEFLCELLIGYGLQNGRLTVQEVKWAVETFEENFIDLSKTVGQFVKTYPEVLGDKSEGETHSPTLMETKNA